MRCPATRIQEHLRQAQPRQRGPSGSAIDTGDEGQFEKGDVCEIDLILLDLARGRGRAEDPLLADNFLERVPVGGPAQDELLRPR